MSFECAKPNCKCLKQFDINDIDKENFNNKISIEDSRDEKENNGYNLSLTLGDFFHLDNNGQIQEKIDGIKNSFSLKMGDLKLKNNISKNISQKNVKQNNKSMIFTNGSVIPGNYVGNLNWTLSPSFHNINDSL
ncbi:hypothetical protein DY124_04970 [Apilactobacillus micheneri]|nr:hypothetical protein [Apilactobacillus micheneri]TPR43655.1 hypothetical protein DY124_04970 [Apilactobacillus micheneri]TPR47583.1 hypothetical protein DY125_04970 [Apilactobacillus micheneri]